MANQRLRTASLVAAVVVAVAGCDASDNTIDPADLTMRDLLGFQPEVAAQWDAAQRASARDVIDRAIGAPAPTPVDDDLGLGVDLDERVAFALGDLDVARAQRGDGALGLVRVEVHDRAVAVDAVPVTLDDATVAPIQLEAAPGWPDGDPLLVRGAPLLSAMATDAGHADGPLLVVRSPRLAVAAAYVDVSTSSGHHAGADGRPHLLVNPVLLAALDPDDDDARVGGGAGGASPTTTAPARAATISFARTSRDPTAPLPAEPRAPVADQANPYSFYGSIAECAYAEQLRCEACMPSNSCEARTVGGDGNAECTAFAANSGAGYTLWCINEALAIGGVSNCVSEDASSCVQDTQAVQSIDALSSNMDFVTDTACAGTLDTCLAHIYGPSQGTYPDQGGTDQPRDTNVGCTDSSPNCTFDPSCNTSGPSCNNSTSCQGSCANSTNQGGCGGDCSSCSSDSGSSSSSGGSCSSGSGGNSGCGSSGSGSGSSGSCSSCSSGSGSGSSGSCSSCSSGSGSSGGSSSSCSSCSSGSGSSGGSSSSCNSCSSGSSGGSSGGGCSGGSGGSCGGGGGNSNCSVAQAPARIPPIGLFLQVVWAVIPVPLALRARKRAKKRAASRDDEVKS